MIVKTKEGYVIKSKSGQVVSKPYKDKKDAEKRLKEIEFFKHKKK
jgi:hypothetical protein